VARISEAVTSYVCYHILCFDRSVNQPTIKHTAYWYYCLCSTLYLGGTRSDFGLEWMSLPPPHVSASRGWQLSGICHHLPGSSLNFTPWINTDRHIVLKQYSTVYSPNLWQCGSWDNCFYTPIHIICMVPDSSLSIRATQA